MFLRLYMRTATGQNNERVGPSSSNIFKADIYEFKIFTPLNEYYDTFTAYGKFGIEKNVLPAISAGNKVEYRKRQPEKKESSRDKNHRYILSSWWLIEGNWYKVHTYNPEKFAYYLGESYFLKYSDFSKYESAPFPPEK